MIEVIRQAVKRGMTRLAKQLNRIFAGKLTPNMVSLLSLAGHGVITWTLYQGQLALSAILIVIFGLMDALDGALARVQGEPKAAGMLLDASSDRVKESLIYFGLGAYFLQSSIDDAPKVLICLAALSGSMMVSYIKAKGETALTDLTANEKNSALKDGFFRYEIRMALLIVGLLIEGAIYPVLVAIAILSWLTAADRFQRIYRRLS